MERTIENDLHDKICVLILMIDTAINTPHNPIEQGHCSGVIECSIKRRIKILKLIRDSLEKFRPLLLDGKWEGCMRCREEIANLYLYCYYFDKFTWVDNKLDPPEIRVEEFRKDMKMFFSHTYMHALFCDLFLGGFSKWLS